MIPHVYLPRGHINQERSAFARGPKERQLRVIVDRATAPAGEGLDLLLRFAGHPLVEVLSTRAEGLPRLAVSPIDPATDQARTVITRPAGPTNYSAVRSASRALGLADELLQASPAIGDREEVIRVLLLAFAAAECYGADALVTGSPILLDRAIQRPGAPASNAMTVAEGLALLGLHLRLRGDFTMDRGPGYRGSIDRGLFYWDLARALLPSTWRCGSGAQQYGQATGDDRMLPLVLSAITRLGNSLRARDYLHGQLKLVQTHDTADDALFYLDTFLVFMVGAFDAIGRVAHLACGLNSTKLRGAQWRDDTGWRPKQLQPVAPALAQLMNKGTPARDALDMLALLRNTIHGEALRSVGVQRPGRLRESLLLLPKDKETELLTVVARRGGNQTWGISKVGSRGVAMEMDRFIEEILPQAAAALDTLIQEISDRITKLPGVQAGSLPTGPPASDPLDPTTGGRLQLLAGL